MKDKTKKDCGILAHISSLPSPYGIGDLGESAYRFADFLHAAGQSYWQVLPIGPTSYGDSPYQSPSAFAGNPYFVSPDDLAARGLLTHSELENAKLPYGKVDYGRIYGMRIPLLKTAYTRFDTADSDFRAFCDRNDYWLGSYALFCALKENFGMKPHWLWDKEYGDSANSCVLDFARTHGEQTGFYKFVQYMFDCAWRKLKNYTYSLGIKIIGDAPIYAAYDSADFWENPRRFLTDSEGNLTCVAGVPPDYFSADGQLWGNPLYDWDYLREHGYDFWTNRMRRSAELYDMLRIDHFRAFADFYAVPAGSENARAGEWLPGPGKEFFDCVAGGGNACPEIIAEDLGLIGENVHKLVRDCGFPGMKVLQFGFDGAARTNPHAPCNYSYDYIGYTGTHDNDTAQGWYSALSAEARKRVRARLPKGKKSIPDAMIHALFASRVRTAIVPIQDWLGEGGDARMNVPGTDSGNWAYRMSGIPSEKTSDYMRICALEYGRAKLQ